ncbi:Holliday junction branch migration protein RuvA [Mechercharimyces sp. CAU 1602]|uniref:Holliday junction branch migration protein RuvA n=1 Tax=Mechercharimyces sp. CAU 1602 TaxID=2973933 RepID=UPI002163F310|nr:Holliday junction branch migration protein RuvA [Mechercharimyces sp. CAU 1602]MCS1351411.1 Holliday junction branch migration protein RuvA [Mechercharimyces sp. CAU 1602]
MIEFVRGTIAYIKEEYVAVATGSLGYQVYCKNPYRYEEREDVLFYTHFVVREDAHLLYGFSEQEERDLFRLLLAVSRVGPKAALGILSGGSPQEVVAAIENEDIAFLTRLPGIGKKTAQRMILDLKDKLEKEGWNTLFPPDTYEQAENVSQPPHERTKSDAIEALVALGYNEGEAKQAVTQVSRERTDQAVDEWIKQALTLLMKG